MYHSEVRLCAKVRHEVVCNTHFRPAETHSSVKEFFNVENC